MLHVDPVKGAVDGGALGVEFSVALELGAVNAQVVPDLRQSRVYDTVSGEAVMKQHVAGDVRLDQVDRVLAGVEDSRAREVEGAVDPCAHKTHRAEVAHQKRRVAVDDRHVAEHRSGARAPHRDALQMSRQQVDSFREVAAYERQRLVDGEVGEIQGAGDARASESESAGMNKSHGLGVADEPFYEFRA